MDLSAVIIHYRSPDALAECLRALAAEMRPTGSGVEAELLVIDNDSRDGTPARLAAEFPDVRVIANADNLGYARAVNQGIAATRAPAVLVLNPDCWVHPGALRALLDHLAAHPRAAVAAPRILNTDGTLEYSARGFPSAFTFLFNRYSLLTRLFPANRWSRRYLLSDWDHASPRDVDWVSGACMLVRRAAVEQVGGMDEAFFMFNEDVDWCRRFHDAGWTNAYVPAATVTHHIGASKGKVAPRVLWGRHLGMIHYYRKHHHPNPLALALVAAMVMGRAVVMLAANAVRGR
jgi:N-acetylglucosaminyl-diphospho-decaprenol L-rhamnosyltransferase